MSKELTVSEAAAIIGIEPRSVSRAIRDGRLIPTRKLPGKTGPYLLDLDEVRKYAGLHRSARPEPAVVAS
ncbi:helix-turn-helix domain-containing protein [Mycobacteroides salmoniphilum]|uniref:helix-turn-helix domain-containing protein n=1 Tax=Mycobacteroides salmoniphilum TaxID=404941 RepID=UPI00356825AD